MVVLFVFNDLFRLKRDKATVAFIENDNWIFSFTIIQIIGILRVPIECSLSYLILFSIHYIERLLSAIEWVVYFKREKLQKN